eukprot:255332-Amorphochlora_amoeboformis.AAC.1
MVDHPRFEEKEDHSLKLLEGKGFHDAGRLKDAFKQFLHGDAKVGDLVSSLGDIVENTTQHFKRIIKKVKLVDPCIVNIVLEYGQVLHKIRTQATSDAAVLNLHKHKIDSKLIRVKRKVARGKRFSVGQLQVDRQMARYLREISNELVLFSSFIQRGFTGDSPYLKLVDLLRPIIVKSQSLLDKYRCSKKRALISLLASGALNALVLGCAVATGPFFPIATIVHVIATSLTGSGSASSLAILFRSFRRRRVNYTAASKIRDHAIGVGVKLEKVVSKGRCMYYYDGLSPGEENGADGKENIFRECEKAGKYIGGMLACINGLIKSSSKSLLKPSK